MFFVFNKQKIYTYLVSIITVVLLLCVANTMNKNKDIIETSTLNNSIVKENTLNSTNEEKNNLLENQVLNEN